MDIDESWSLNEPGCHHRAELFILRSLVAALVAREKTML